MTAFGNFDVSRETIERLEHYAALLEKWNPKINLVSPASLANRNQRHFEDSLQIVEHMNFDWSVWADLGSGGGFPGLVLAIYFREHNPDAEFHLVESDQRKSAFLRTVVRETNANVIVHTQRAEQLDSLNADVISARALASLDQLLGYAYRHGHNQTTCVFPKGETWKIELEEASKRWRFQYECHKSKTNPDSVILSIGALSHA